MAQFLLKATSVHFDQSRKLKETGYDWCLICNHDLEIVFPLRSHSVCQLTIERTLNKNKIVTEGASKHGEACLKKILCLKRALFQQEKPLSWIAGTLQRVKDMGVKTFYGLHEGYHHGDGITAVRFAKRYIYTYVLNKHCLFTMLTICVKCIYEQQRFLCKGITETHNNATAICKWPVFLEKNFTIYCHYIYQLTKGCVDLCWLRCNYTRF